MTFKTWFRLWCRSITKFLMSPYARRRHRSYSERRRAREYRIKMRRLRQNRYYVAHVMQKRGHRRSSGTMTQLRSIRSVFHLFGVVLGVLLLPVGLLHWGHQNAKRKRRAEKISAERTSTGKKSEKTSPPPKTKSSISRTEHASEPSARTVAADRAVPAAPTEPTTPPPTAGEPTEVLAKRTQASEEAECIRRRMIIAGSSYCDERVLSRLEIGSCLDVVAEPDNPHDKKAVSLLLEGEKVGYVAKKDQLPFVASLGLGRSMYAVVTNILIDETTTQYEYEAWVGVRGASSKK